LFGRCDACRAAGVVVVEIVVRRRRRVRAGSRAGGESHDVRRQLAHHGRILLLVGAPARLKRRRATGSAAAGRAVFEDHRAHRHHRGRGRIFFAGLFVFEGGQARDQRGVVEPTLELLAEERDMRDSAARIDIQRRAEDAREPLVLNAERGELGRPAPDPHLDFVAGIAEGSLRGDGRKDHAGETPRVVGRSQLTGAEALGRVVLDHLADTSNIGHETA
jgi:hypothetical protein